MALEHDIDDLREELERLRARVNAIDHLDDLNAASSSAVTLADMLNILPMAKATRANIRRYTDDLLQRLRRK